MSSDDRPSVYREGDRTVYRVSALGGCERSLLAARVGAVRHPFPKLIQEAFQQGHDNEDAILSRFAEDHTDIRLMGREQQYVEIDGPTLGLPEHIMIRGAMDELAMIIRGEGRGTKVVVDAKAFAESSYRNLEAGYHRVPFWDSYLTQLTLYMLGSGATEAVLAVGRKGPDKTVTADQPVSYHWIKYGEEEGRLKEIADKITRVEQLAAEIITATETGELVLPEQHAGIKTVTCPADFACQYPQFHDEKDSGTRLDGEQAEALIALAELSEHISATEKRIKQIKDERNQLLTELVEVHGNKMSAGEWTVNWIENEVEETTRVIKAHTRRYPKFTRKKQAVDWAGTGIE